MQTTDINPQAVLALAQTLPDKSPIVMLNLVRYKSTAAYSDGQHFTACSGAEAYLQRYAPAFNEVAAAEGVTGIKVNYISRVVGLLAGPPAEQWDAMVVVEYPSFSAFRKVTESPQYRTEAEPHRKAALQDWRLMATLPL